MAELILARVKELLHYDPETGAWTQKTRRKGSGLIPGEPAGCIAPSGYLMIGIDYRRYRAHRLAWLWMTGEMPANVDHINGNRADNRWGNLRVADQSQNTANSKRSKANTSGFKGVSRHWPSGKWQAGIVKNRRRQYLGLFETPKQAHDAYCVKAKEIYGEFARTE